MSPARRIALLQVRVLQAEARAAAADADVERLRAALMRAEGSETGARDHEHLAQLSAEAASHYRACALDTRKHGGKS